MERISGAINVVMKELTTKKGTDSGSDPQGWLKKSLTKKDLGHIKFNYFRKGVLGVSVDSSARLYRLGLQKNDLLVSLRKFSSEIKDIRFTIGEF